MWHSTFLLIHELLSHDSLNAAALTLAGVVYVQWAGSRERRRVHDEKQQEDDARANVPRMIEDMRVYEIANHALAEALDLEREETERLRGRAEAEGKRADQLEGWLSALAKEKTRLVREAETPQEEP